MWREPKETWTLNAIFSPRHHCGVTASQCAATEKKRPHKCRKRYIYKIPHPRQPTNPGMRTDGCCVCVRTPVCEQIDFVQSICFMCVWWLKTDKGCVWVYVPTIHPWKQTLIERMVLFIRSSRHVTCSHRPRAKKRPFGLSIQPLPPCWTFHWNYSKSNK